MKGTGREGRGSKDISRLLPLLLLPRHFLIFQQQPQQQQQQQRKKKKKGGKPPPHSQNKGSKVELRRIQIKKAVFKFFFLYSFSGLSFFSSCSTMLVSVIKHLQQTI